MVAWELLPMPNGTSSPQDLDPEHFAAFDVALKNVLSTPIAHETIVQLIDGLPLRSVLVEAAGVSNLGDAPINEHTSVCDGAVDRANDFISSFNAAALSFDPKLLQAFQNAPLGTNDFGIRLLEMVARAVHCIAVSIDKLETKSHKGDIGAVVNYKEPAQVFYNGQARYETETLDPFPSLFFHCEYTEHEQYPFGISDLPGYWAEDRIFGGVVLFDRGESGTEAKSVWFHSGRDRWTTRIWKPLDWQWNCIMNVFKLGPEKPQGEESSQREDELSEAQRSRMRQQWKSESPFFCDSDNFNRHNADNAMEEHNIYRDKWERYAGGMNFQSCTVNDFDNPELRTLAETVIQDPAPFHSIHQNDSEPGVMSQSGDRKGELVATFDSFEVRTSSRSDGQEATVQQPTDTDRSGSGEPSAIVNDSSLGPKD